MSGEPTIRPSRTSVLQMATGKEFGTSEGHDSAVASTGVAVQLTPAISTYVNYDGKLGRRNYDSNAVTGRVRINF